MTEIPIGVLRADECRCRHRNHRLNDSFILASLKLDINYDFIIIWFRCKNLSVRRQWMPATIAWVFLFVFHFGILLFSGPVLMSNSNPFDRGAFLSLDQIETNINSHLRSARMTFPRSSEITEDMRILNANLNGGSRDMKNREKISADEQH